MAQESNQQWCTVQPEDKPLWHILGAGAMGCLWAARICQAFSPGAVELLLRDSLTLSRYRAAGGILLEEGGAVTRCPVNASVVPPSGQIQRLIVSTKAQDAQTALDAVAPFLAPAATVILLQNGLRQLSLASCLPGKRVYCLSTSHGAYQVERFHVVHAGVGAAHLGQVSGVPDDCATLLSLLPSETLRVQCVTDIRRHIWLKYAVNCAANGLTVIHECRNGELLTLPAARTQLEALCAEIEQIFAGLPEAPRVSLWTEVRKVLTATASNYSSTLQDVRAGRETEIGELNGYLCDLAQAHGLRCELNLAISEAVAAAQAGNAPWGDT